MCKGNKYFPFPIGKIMLALLDTGFSNLKAYSNVLNYLDIKFEIIDNGNLLNIDKHQSVLLPGVSTFGTLSEELLNRHFFFKLKSFASNGQRIIGTCSGMQILFTSSEESTGVLGLDLIPGDIKKFPFINNVDINIGWRKTDSGEYFFVHGYYCDTVSELDNVTYAEFNGQKFISEFRYKNIFGFQYHPEKSSITGVDQLKKIILS